MFFFGKGAKTGRARFDARMFGFVRDFDLKGRFFVVCFGGDCDFFIASTLH